MDESSPLWHEPETAKSVWSDAEEQQVVRKLDLRIFPIAVLLNIFCFLERINLGNVHDAIVRQLSLQEWEYSVAASMFFVTYILCEVPSNIILQRVRPSQYLSFLCFSFGLVSSCTMFVDSFGGLVGLRMVLGACESGFYPGIIFFLSLWFRREERALRISIIACGSSIAGLLGGLLAYGALQIQDFLGIVGWQWLFLIEGIPTMFLSLICLYVLPDRPEQATWLSSSERYIAHERLTHSLPSSSATVPTTTASKQAPAKPTESRAQQIFQVFARVEICGFGLLYFTMMLNMYAVAFFLPSIIKSMGFSSLYGNLLTAPVYLVAVLCILGMAWHSDATRERPWHVSVGACSSILGFLGLTLGTFYNVEIVSLISIAIANAGTNSIMPVTLAWINDVTFGDLNTAIALAFVLAVGNLGGIVGPQLYGLTVTELEGKSSYIWGHAAMTFNSLLMASVTLFLGHYLARRRRKEQYEILDK